MICQHCKKETYPIDIEEVNSICVHCGYGIDAELTIEITKQKAKLLTDFLNNEYIHYENSELIKLVRELNEFVDGD